MWSSLKTKKIALAGILLAISTICLLLALYLPTSKLAFLSAASFITGAAIREVGLKFGLAYSMGTYATGFLVMSGLPIYVVYAVLFAPYGLVREVLEKISNKILKSLLKVVYFNVVFFLFLKVFESIIFDFNGLKRLLGLSDGDYLLYVVIFVAGNIAFIIYDMAFEAAMRFYKARISPIINKNN